MTVSEMGRKGAKAKYAKMSAEERSQGARNAVNARWARTTAEERSAFGKKIRAGRKTAKKSTAKKQTKR
jgi:hypothetical protein